jgi:hypothetical protein
MDVYHGGWQQDVRTLRGNVDQENVWHQATVDLGGYLSSDFKIRFRAWVSGSREDGNVDDVQIVASGTAMGGSAAGSALAGALPLVFPQAAGNSGGEVGSGSSDASSELAAMEDVLGVEATTVFFSPASGNADQQDRETAARDAAIEELDLNPLDDEFVEDLAMALS